ncbi:MAG: formate dehydrogenase accessory sulfurtransferase FdhD [Candidatus Acidiferrales bacterium]
MGRTPRSVGLTQVSEWDDGKLRRKDDYLAAEEPLEIRVGNEPVSVTMRTPGHDQELAAGFLFTEGLIQDRGQLLGLEDAARENDAENAATSATTTGPATGPATGTTIGGTTGTEAGAKNGNVIQARISVDAAPDMEKMRRNFFAASSCGICGKASIDAIRARGLATPNPDFRLDAEILVRLPERLRSAQDVFERTGGLHAAALFNAQGELLVLREDIGRHNAVDKVIGWALLENRVPLAHSVLLVSGRGGFEIVQKAIVAGLPVVASVSAPSSLAVQLARELRLTLIGFLRGRRFVIYSGVERIARAEHEA